jgi:2-epi-5-epi-valiolone synthase
MRFTALESTISRKPASEDTGVLAVGSPVSHWLLRAVKPVSYEVRIVDNLLDPANPALLEDASPRAGDSVRRLAVTDANVDRIYGERIRRYLDAHGVKYEICVLDAGEENKTLQAVQRVTAALDAFGIDRRREPVIAIGGGVLMDIVGFTCSAYRRATPFIRVPTTLVGLVDAGVGVKTGVNVGGYKNRLGSYFPAERTLLDRTFLRTLPRRHLSNGLAEVLKMALIKDCHLFGLLEHHAQTLLGTGLQGSSRGDADHFDDIPPSQRLAALPPRHGLAADVLDRAVHAMLCELQPNLWEASLERIVDYGHTFSPSLEMAALPELLHGEAVNIDMALTTLIAENRGLVTAAQRRRVFDVMRLLELPVWHRLCTGDLLIRALQGTVRHRDGAQRSFRTSARSRGHCNSLILPSGSAASYPEAGHSSSTGLKAIF